MPCLLPLSSLARNSQAPCLPPSSPSRYHTPCLLPTLFPVMNHKTLPLFLYLFTSASYPSLSVSYLSLSLSCLHKSQYLYYASFFLSLHPSVTTLLPSSFLPSLTCLSMSRNHTPCLSYLLQSLADAQPSLFFTSSPYLPSVRFPLPMSHSTFYLLITWTPCN